MQNCFFDKLIFEKREFDRRINEIERYFELNCVHNLLGGDNKRLIKQELRAMRCYSKFLSKKIEYLKRSKGYE